MYLHLPYGAFTIDEEVNDHRALDTIHGNTFEFGCACILFRLTQIYPSLPYGNA